MSVDRSRVLATAQKHLAKGHYDKAIAEYLRLVQSDPRDVRTWLKVGDLYTRKGATREACDTYNRVAEQYAQQGFFLKAVAVYKQILKLDGSRLDTSVRLAEMYENLQLVSDALNTYEHVAGVYERSGQTDEALEMLGKMCALDPENIPVRIKYAEALSRAGRTEEAAAAFEAGGELLKEQGRLDDYAKVAERLLYHRPKAVELAKELAHYYVEHGDAKRSLPKLQLCFKSDPRDVTTLELLARAFEKLGQRPKTLSVLQEIAKIHGEGGRKEDQAATLHRILQLDPEHAEAKKALADLGSAVASLPPPSLAPPGLAPSSVVPRPEPEAPVTEAAALEPEELEELEVIEEAQELMEEDEGEEDEDLIFLPEDNADSDAFDDDNAFDRDDAFAEAALQATSQVGAAEAVEVEAGSFEEVDELMAEALAQDGAQLVSGEAVATSGLPEEGLLGAAMPAEELTGTGDHGSLPPDVAREIHVARLLTECDVFMRYGLRGKVIDQLGTILQIEPRHVLARERLRDVYLEEGRVSEAIEELITLARMLRDQEPQAAVGYLHQVLGLDQEHSEARELLTSIDAQAQELGVLEVASAQHALPTSEFEEDDPGLEAMSPQEFEAVPLSEKPAQASASRPPGEVEEILEEVDFFLAQGLEGEARGTLDEALLSHPGNALLSDKLAELDEPMAPVSENLKQTFQLAQELADEFEAHGSAADAGAASLDVESVFAQFKQGVQQTVADDDVETHFDLGIAYKEMGLINDAVAEFKVALKSPQKKCTAHTMIGLCHLEEGRFEEAVQHFGEALSAPDKTDREELGLFFEIGAACELLGNEEQALEYFLKVRQREPGFRNVEERIRAIQGPNQGMDDVDRAFDDLINEGD